MASGWNLWVCLQCIGVASGWNVNINVKRQSDLIPYLARGSLGTLRARNNFYIRRISIF